jgi:3-hydroxyacyl-[acyl-carrier-protein] dehydratase
MIPGLPHREPFVFIDAVRHVDAGAAALCEKTFAADHPVFAGHFPGNPIVPGVLLTEALAQTAGLAGAAGDGGAFLLSAIRSMKFPAAAGPEELILLEAKKTGELGGLLIFSVKAAVGERVVAEGQIVLNRAAI